MHRDSIAGSVSSMLRVGHSTSGNQNGAQSSTTHRSPSCGSCAAARSSTSFIPDRSLHAEATTMALRHPATNLASNMVRMLFPQASWFKR